MEKTAKINSTELLNITRNTYKPHKTVSWNGIDITIKHTLPLHQVMSFVDAVSKLCFTEDTGAYLPEVKDFGIKACILEMYANIELSKSTEEVYELIYCSDIVSVVMANVNQVQLSEIANAIDEKISHIASANIESITYQMNDLYNAFDNLEKQISQAFSGISSEDMTKIVGAISGSELDEVKLAKAYIGQKTDKSNVVPISKKGR